ncbi:MAG TPA: glycosyltransferase family 39 protein [Bryobacteraceae bacterium]|nr:glycosyltransferase family 39 protein [Bryobacteraceae bacterium]
MTQAPSAFRRYQLIVLLFAAITFLGCIVNPPSLMDDVDSVQASIARTMLRTGDWVTPHLDGIKYFEKPPLKYWLIAIFFKLFGVHDYIARLPEAILDILLCWLTFRIGVWAFGNRTGLYAGLALSTCLGLFLFTRVLFADSQLTLTIALAMWSFLRAVDPEERRPRVWGLVAWASIGVGLLFKGLIGAVFPFASAFLYLLFTRQLFRKETWRRLVPGWGILVLLAIAAPWHILATLQNPPYLYFSMHSGPGSYHGFFWFYFFNEHILRFLNRRYPRDYNTVPRLYFWLFNLLWLFPWSVYFPVLLRLRYRGADRASRTRLFALCWIGFLMVFFSFSTTQEYYSMPIYPALALLLACGMASATPAIRAWLRRGDILLGTLCALASAAITYILVHVWTLPTPGDISDALHEQSESAYTLSLAHIGDLTLHSFAYLRSPLIVAAVGFLIGLFGVLLLRRGRRFMAVAAMMVVFFQAARLALVAFDPYLSSRPLADALLKSPPGQLIVDDQYYTFSSLFFYADTKAYLHNGRINNLEYGSYSPEAPDIFIDDSQLARMWHEPTRYYLAVTGTALPRIEQVIGKDDFTVVKESGGKYLLVNQGVAKSALLSKPDL